MASQAHTTSSTSRRRGPLAAATAAAAGGILLSVAFAAAASAATQATAGTRLNCAAAPAACGYPAAATAGVPAGTTLLTVPGQVSSGPGWHYDPAAHAVEVTGSGAVLAGLRIPCTLDITASGVTILDTQVTTGATFAVSLRHTTGTTIENSAISGLDTTAGRADYAIDDVYGDSAATTIKNDNIYNFRTAIQITTGLITGNYIHDPGYITGDHTNGIYAAGTAKPLTITGNTILDNLPQTDAINLDAAAPGQQVANKTITGNLLAGGSYTIYAGHTLGAITSGITITGNRFSQAYYPGSGLYGPATYYNAQGPGNTWASNIWDTTGHTTPAP
jgi:Right handed beta helix region